MCRLTAVLCSGTQVMLLAEILTRPRMSIIRQSFHCKERNRIANPRWAYEVSSLNGDGFGVGWYLPPWNRHHECVEKPECPCVFTSLKPAWSDRNLVNIAENTLSHLIFAHVRAAGPGSGWSSEMNCHPFQYGKFLFMHNGTIGDWTLVKQRFLSLLSPAALDFVLATGVIDSVVIFGIIISQLEKGPYGDYSTNELRIIMERTLSVLAEVVEEKQISEPSFLNFLLTDGNAVLAVRHTIPPPTFKANKMGQASLYFATGTKWARDPNTRDMYRMVHTDKRNEVAIITSEPLTDSEEEWVAVPRSHILIVTGDVDVLIYKVPKRQKILSHMLICARSKTTKNNLNQKQLIEHSKQRSSRGSNRGEPAVEAPAVIEAGAWLPPLRCFDNFCKCCGKAQYYLGPRPTLTATVPSLPPYIGLSKGIHSDKLIPSLKTQPFFTADEKATPVTSKNVAVASPPTDSLCPSMDKLANESTTTATQIQSIAQSLTLLSQPETPASLPSLRTTSEIPVHTEMRKSVDEPVACDDSLDEFLWDTFLSTDHSPPVGSELLGSCGVEESTVMASSFRNITDIPCRHILVGGRQRAILCLTSFTVALNVDKISPDVSYRFDRRLPLPYAVIGTQDGFVSVWALDEGVCHTTMEVSQGAVLCLSLVHVEAPPLRYESNNLDSEDQRQLLLFVGSSDTTLSIWDLSAFLRVPESATFEFSARLLSKISFSPAQGDILSLVLHNSTGCPAIFAGFQTTAIGFFFIHDVINLIRNHHKTCCDSNEIFKGVVTFPHEAMDCDFCNTRILNDDVGNVAFGDSILEPSSLTPSSRLLIHTLHYKDKARHCGFIESLISYGDFLCSGGGDGLILVWKTYRHFSTLVGHRGGILCLAASSELHNMTLYSGSRDQTIRVWDLETLSCKRTLRGHSSDVLSLVVCNSTLFSGSATGELFCWCRRTSKLLMQFDASAQTAITALNLVPITTTSSMTLHIYNKTTVTTPGTLKLSLDKLDMDEDNDSHHFKDLTSASAGPENTMTGITNNGDSLNHLHHELSLPISNTSDPSNTCSYLRRTYEYDGCFSRMKTSLPLYNNCTSGARHPPQGFRLIATGGDGIVRFWRIQPSSRALLYDYIDTLDSSDTNSTGNSLMFRHYSSHTTLSKADLLTDLEKLLRSFVAIPSVSGRSVYLEDCWRAARFLSNCFSLVGATTQLVDVGPGLSPLVVARLGFDATCPTVLFYSHYDVVPAGYHDDDPITCRTTNNFTSVTDASVVLSHTPKMHAPHWRTIPWNLTLIDGYYYGRGVTDNKGPLLAQLFAVLALRQSLLLTVSSENTLNRLPVNVVWVSEGEEENGSTGFETAIAKLCKTTNVLDNVSCVICNNSYWVNDNIPCLVSGMRGVIDVTITIQGSQNAVGHHSGFHGGAIAEPMLDLLYLLGKIIGPNGRVQVPGFYDNIDKELQELDAGLFQTSELHDLELYKRQINNAGLRDPRPSAVYRTRWLEPVMSVTEIWSSTQETRDLGQTFRVIPSKANCNISIRTVPKQDRNVLSSQLENFVVNTFKESKSPNTVSVKIVNSSDWWTGDTKSQIFKAALSAVSKVWGRDPLIVREGGTMPVIRFLQDTFRVPAVHVPIGQASDAAHLPNERLRVINLRRGIDTLQNFLMNIGNL